MKRWQASCLGAFIALLVCGGSLFFLVPFGGSMIIGVPPLFNQLTAYALCPDATDYSYNDYGFGQAISSDPTSGTGHYTELTCTYKDGSQKTFPNEEVFLKGMGASFGVVGVGGGVIALLFMIAVAIVGARFVKPQVAT
jgi:hypothetical protein